MNDFGFDQGEKRILTTKTDLAIRSCFATLAISFVLLAILVCTETANAQSSSMGQWSADSPWPTVGVHLAGSVPRSPAEVALLREGYRRTEVAIAASLRAPLSAT